MRKLSLIAFLIIGLLLSCKKDTTNVTTQTISIDKIYNAQSNLKRAFGKSLLKSMQESPMLRSLLKEEALNQFDNDYEVLYYLIKDKTLENGQSVHDLITKNLDGNLDEILKTYPTLTILVPELPENSFSAARWDAVNTIPAVAINTGFYNDIPMINTNGKEEVIPGNRIPGFPIIVVKNNERLISNSQNPDFDNYETRIVYDQNGLKLRFWADGFDRRLNTASRRTDDLDQKLVSAYNIYQNSDGWQRDYIYYNIQPSSPNGSFQNNFKESMRSFQVGDVSTTTAMAAYQKISDQTGDPIMSGAASTSSNQSSHWGGGIMNLELNVE